MPKYVTAGLTDALLDAAVALAEGCCIVAIIEGRAYVKYDESPKVAELGGPLLSYSHWDMAGPIIARERIDLTARGDGWFANCGQVQHGHTPTIAAMRAFVAAKLGKEIELPCPLGSSDVTANQRAHHTPP